MVNVRQYPKSAVRLAFFVLVCLVLALAIALYCPGRTGGLLLDDVVNLNLLDDLGSLYDVDQLMQFLILQGKNNTLGRPVSLLSFALQVDAWHNHDFAAFKLVNIAIHLANGLLLLLIAIQIGRQLQYSDNEVMVCSLFALAFWVLHPINVSTVLYIVQRMAQLSTLFMLFAVLVYLNFRMKISGDTTLPHYLLFTCLIALLGLLALFSKENGVLLPTILFVVEATIFSSALRPKIFRQWMLCVLVFPTVVLLAYLAYKGLNPNVSIRSYTVTDRLLTEPRVIWNYLARIFLPRPSAFGLFYDDVAISKGWVEPLVTAPALLALFALPLIAWLSRERLPALSFGLLWYFSGHMLESTTIMLEIGFEHRNYFPLIGLVIGVCYECAKFCRRFVRPQVSIALAILCLAFVSLLTLAESTLWGSQLKLAAVWAREKPRSERAQDLYAGILAQEGYVLSSYKYFKRSSEIFPDSASAISAATLLYCLDVDLPVPDYLFVAGRFSTSRFSFGPITNIGKMIEEKESGRCKKIKPETIRLLISGLLANPAYQVPEYKSHLYMYLGRTYALDRELGPAIANLTYACVIYPRLDVAVHKVAWLISAKAWADARMAMNDVMRLAKDQPIDYVAFRPVITKMNEVIGLHVR